MKVYKCDICGALFVDRLRPTLPNGLIIAGTGLESADICAECLKILRGTVRDLSLVTEEKPDESKTSSSEC